MKFKLVFVLSILISFVYFHEALAQCQQKIPQKYQNWPNAKNELGQSTSEVVQGANGGYFQRYEHSIIYCHEDVGTFAVYGQILDKYGALNWEQGFLGYPRTDELWTPDHSGRFQLYEHGNIYWKSGIGAFEVHGRILGKYGEHKYEQGFLRYPLSDELETGDGRGRYQRFEGGSIYWTPETDAWIVLGAIFEKWGDYQWEQGFLGYPITDEVDPGDGRGRFQRFEGGLIYLTPETGAHEVHGYIFDKWGEDQWEKGKLGYPITDILKGNGKDAVYCEFEHGRIDWNPMQGAKVTYK